MATIPLRTNTFRPIPEGVHVFRIYDVEYNETFGRMSIYLVNAQGKTHIERFTLMRTDGAPNDSAYGALAFFAKTALNNFDLEEIDHTELINRYIKANVVHTTQPNKNDPTKTVTFTNLTEKWSADGFETEPCDKALTLCAEDRLKAEAKKKEKETKVDSGNVDLSALLN